MHSTQFISVVGLPTHSLTIHPKGATVVRKIPVTLGCGTNEVLITDITKSADEESFRARILDGSALVVDIKLQHGAPPPIVESDEDSCYQTDTDEEGLWPDELRQCSEKLKALEAAAALSSSKERAMRDRLSALDSRLDAFESDRTGDLGFLLELHKKEHLEADEEIAKTAAATAETQEKISKTKRRLQKLKRRFARTQTEARKRRARRSHVRSARQMEANLRSSISMRGVWQANITIESDEESESTLYLAYAVGPQVAWRPRYDILLDTSTRSGTLTYRALIENKTGEDWKDAKVTLSTNQTVFGGLDEKRPVLIMWPIGLDGAQNTSQAASDDILFSPVERPVNPQPMPGVNPQLVRTSGLQAMTNSQMQDYQMQLMLLEQQNKNRLLMARTEQDGGAPRQMAQPQGGVQLQWHPQQQMQERVQQQAQMQQQMYMQQVQQMPSTQQASIAQVPVGPSPEEKEDEDPAYDSDTSSASSSIPKPRSTTAFYSVPNLISLRTSSSPHRILLAEIPQKNICFSHLTVPKLRRAAFLRAAITNTSPHLILPGVIGVTLDSMFLGTTEAPRCLPKDSFMLSLGVDNTVPVRYSKPRRHITSGGQGLFGMKERETVIKYERNIVLANEGKEKIAVSVYDQMPVSEDQRLKVTMVEPRGLKEAGDTVHNKEKGWDVTLRENGQACWEVGVACGQQAKLTLAWEIRVPEGWKAVNR